MTLHEAIEQILREARRPMKSSEIAAAINARQLYVKGDQSNVSGSQVYARVNKYPELFKIGENGILLHDLSIRPYQDFMMQATNHFTKFFPGNHFRITNLVGAFLVLIYYRLHKISIYPTQIYNSKGFLISLFKQETSDDEKLNRLFRPIVEYVSNSLSEYEVDQILKLLSRYKFNELKKPNQRDFSIFLNDTINSFNWKNNNRGSEFSTPKLVSSLMCSLYELPEHAKVFDPFAGRASILTELINTHSPTKIGQILAGDIDYDCVTIGSLNIYGSGESEFNYERRNAFMDWEIFLGADTIITNPPLGGKIGEPSFFYTWQIIATTDISINAIQLCLHHLNHSNGKAVIVIPESVLFSTNAAATTIRKKIIDANLLDGIILLPKTIFKPYASVGTAVLMINYSRQSESEGIFMYDASDVPVNEFKAEINDILENFHSKTSKKERVRWVSISEVVLNSYDLTIKRYLLPPVEGKEFISIKELLENAFAGNYVGSENINIKEGTPYIQVSDLYEGEGIGEISIADLKSFISDIEIVSSSIKEIPNGAVLISKVGTKLKPTLFNSDNYAVANSSIICLKPGPALLPEYLISQLQSEYLQKQIEVIRRYNAIPNINLKALLEIKIRNLPLDQQLQYVTTYYSRKLLEVKKSDTKIKEDELYNLISRIKHEVKQPVSSIGIDINILEGYLKQKEASSKTISLNDYAIEPLKGQSESDLETTKVQIILDRIKNSVDEAQNTLRKAEETLNINKGDLNPEFLEIKDFIETFICPLYINANLIFQLAGREHTISADKYQLKVVFKNLIENAIKFGFIENKPKEQNIIRIQIKKEVERGFVEINVMNNGKPFSEGFNNSLFETKGITTDRNNGSGFGGYHIKRIIDNHKGELQIADEEEVRFSEFKVQFKIFLPIIL